MYHCYCDNFIVKMIKIGLSPSPNLWCIWCCRIVVFPRLLLMFIIATYETTATKRASHCAVYNALTQQTELCIPLNILLHSSPIIFCFFLVFYHCLLWFREQKYLIRFRNHGLSYHRPCQNIKCVIDITQTWPASFNGGPGAPLLCYSKATLWYQIVQMQNWARDKRDPWPD